MKRWTQILAVGIVALAAAAAPGDATADALDDIRKRGRLVVGVKTDQPPYGFLGSDGRIAGMEPDLAQDVAEVLGVQLELVPVVSSNRMQFLDQGRIDLIIATMADTDERRDVVQTVDPSYYASGTNILTKGAFAKWEDLAGVPVCGVQGTVYNRKLAEQYGADLVAFKGTGEALTALKQSRCAAFVYDNAFIISRLTAPEWLGWRMPLPTVDTHPWGVAVKKGEQAFAVFMSGMVVRWHVTGGILDLETKYNLEPTPFARQMHETFLAINPTIER